MAYGIGFVEPPHVRFISIPLRPWCTSSDSLTAPHLGLKLLCNLTNHMCKLGGSTRWKPNSVKWGLEITFHRLQGTFISEGNVIQGGIINNSNHFQWHYHTLPTFFQSTHLNYLHSTPRWQIGSIPKRCRLFDSAAPGKRWWENGLGGLRKTELLCWILQGWGGNKECWYKHTCYMCIYNLYIYTKERPQEQRSTVAIRKNHSSIFPWYSNELTGLQQGIGQYALLQTINPCFHSGLP